LVSNSLTFSWPPFSICVSFFAEASRSSMMMRMRMMMMRRKTSLSSTIQRRRPILTTPPWPVAAWARASPQAWRREAASWKRAIRRRPWSPHTPAAAACLRLPTTKTTTTPTIAGDVFWRWRCVFFFFFLFIIIIFQFSLCFAWLKEINRLNKTMPNKLTDSFFF
jgi:hypothetical protein